MLRTGIFFLLLVIVNPASPALRAEGQRPLDTETARLIPTGQVELELGMAVAWDAHRVLFPGEQGTGLVLPRLGLRTGLGAWGEIRVEGDTWVGFEPSEGDPVQDFGDWRIRTKVRLGPADRRVAWAAQAGLKIPVASDDDGIGTDEADVEIWGIFSWNAGPGRLDANLGVDLLGAPARIGSQEDLLRYGAAYWWRFSRGPLDLGGEVAGRSGGKLFPAVSMLRVGLRRAFGAWRLDVAAGTGLTEPSPSFELRAAATFTFQRG